MKQLYPNVRDYLDTLINLREVLEDFKVCQRDGFEEIDWINVHSGDKTFQLYCPVLSLFKKMAKEAGVKVKEVDVGDREFKRYQFVYQGYTFLSLFTEDEAKK